MKRTREENGPGSQPKRHASLRGEMSAQATQSQRLTTDDALAYLQAVKDIFKDQKGKYDEFLEVMKDFKAQRIDTAGVIARVKDLFKGHRNLILGFNTFLPKGYEITLPPEEEAPKRQPVEYGQAISYVNKIKTRFQQEEQVYKAFLEILNMYRKGNKSISEVYLEVASLFKDHPDLLDEFTCFLPDSSGVGHTIGKASSVPLKDEKNSTMRYPKKEKIVNAPHEVDMTSEKAMDSEQQDHSTTEVDKRERDIKDEKEQQMDLDDKEGAKDVDGMQRLPNKRQSARRADELIRKQSLGGEAGEMTVGTTATVLVEEKKAVKGPHRKLTFFEHVKSKLRSQEAYQEFLKCLNLYSEEIITRKQLHSLVDGLFGKYPELVEGFNDFLAHCESNEGYLANLVSKKLGDGPQLKPKIERERDHERGREGDRTDRRRDAEREREKQLGSKKSLTQAQEKYMTKPISELDLSNCEQCTPSYRLLPKSYPKPVASYRKPLAREVLNDSWVSVTSGSEDYSFKHMRRNQYEESLFRCEDDRFELDMLLESTALTAKRMEELLKKLHEGSTKQDAQFHLDDYLTAINIRCIERIYGDHGLDVIEMLRKNVSVALPVILSRLKQKHEEWLKCKEDMNKVWAEVYAKNYHKSLDHRSFYFKQQDKKSLSMKALTAEIKEINEKKRKDDDFILCRATGNRQPHIADLKFFYPEPDVNEDLYQIIKHSVDEMCSTMEQSDKIMRLWTTFLEPIFGIPSRSHDAEDTEEVSKGKYTKVDDGHCIASKRGASLDIDTDKADVPKSEKMSSTKAEDNGLLGSALDDLKADKSACAGRKNDTALLINSQSVIAYPDRSNDKLRRENDSSQDSEKRIVRTVRENEVTNKVDGARNSRNGRIEREEGELSPSPETDEILDFVTAVKQGGITNHGFVDHMREDDEVECDGKPEVEQDVDADDEADESTPKSSDESDNPSGGAFGSESANADDSQEEHDDEGKNESEGEAEGMADAEGESAPRASSEKLLMSCMPLSTHAPSIISNSSTNAATTVFYGNDTLYVLFRLHQALYERVHAAKVHAIAAEEKQKATKDNSSELYRKFMQLLYSLLDGTIDNVKFEDDCRAIIGTQLYVLFTMDKLIFKLVKQLQSIATDEMANKLLALHVYEKSRASGFVDALYYANASTLLQDENIYRFEHKSSPSQLTIQLMDGGAEKMDCFPNAIESTFVSYLNEYVYETANSRKHHSPVFLRRSKLFKEDNDETAFVKAMDSIFIANGLDCKISCKTYRVSYVLDTEDIIYRRNRKEDNNKGKERKRGDTDKIIDKRVVKFHRWIDSHHNYQKKDR